jgi:hypothetical protein
LKYLKSTLWNFKSFIRLHQSPFKLTLELLNINECFFSASISNSLKNLYFDRKAVKEIFKAATSESFMRNEIIEMEISCFLKITLCVEKRFFHLNLSEYTFIIK